MTSYSPSLDPPGDLDLLNWQVHNDAAIVFELHLCKLFTTLLLVSLIFFVFSPPFFLSLFSPFCLYIFYSLLVLLCFFIFYCLLLFFPPLPFSFISALGLADLFPLFFFLFFSSSTLDYFFSCLRLFIFRDTLFSRISLCFLKSLMFCGVSVCSLVFAHLSSSSLLHCSSFSFLLFLIFASFVLHFASASSVFLLSFKCPFLSFLLIC